MRVSRCTCILVTCHKSKGSVTGEIPLGARLPGEQALRQEYGVALSTVRKAMELLRKRELVTTRPSLGTFVRREIPPPDGSGDKTSAMRG